MSGVAEKGERAGASSEPAPAKREAAKTDTGKQVARPDNDMGVVPKQMKLTTKKKRGRRMLMLAVPLLIAGGGGYSWLTGGRYIATDNAYVHQPMVAVSSDLAGRVARVDVKENQTVEAGAPMFSLDPEPYRIAVDQVEASLAAARLQVKQLRAAYATAKTRLAAVETIRSIRQQEYGRQQKLAARGIASQAVLDQATIALRSAENDVHLAHDGLEAARAALGGDPGIETDDFPAVRAALARLEAAKRDLRKTTIAAPATGVVSQIEGLSPGVYVAPGTTVASVVRGDDTWIEANYKETQLAKLKIGQPVEIVVDAYPDFTLHGKVESFGSATGSQFSLIPTQNATGNWVKVVQRLAVRIHVEPDPAHPLRDGMSAHVSVDTGHDRLDLMK